MPVIPINSIVSNRLSNSFYLVHNAVNKKENATCVLSVCGPFCTSAIAKELLKDETGMELKKSNSLGSDGDYSFVVSCLPDAILAALPQMGVIFDYQSLVAGTKSKTKYFLPNDITKFAKSLAA